MPSKRPLYIVNVAQKSGNINPSTLITSLFPAKILQLKVYGPFCETYTGQTICTLDAVASVLFAYQIKFSFMRSS